MSEFHTVTALLASNPGYKHPNLYANETNRVRFVGKIAMSQSTSHSERTDLGPDVYLPASLMPATLERVEGVLSRLFGRHGLVPIPRSYNK